MININRIIAMIKKELITIWKDPKSRGFIIALPLVQLLMFAFAVTMEVKNIDVTIIDRDNTQLSRELISRVTNSPQFRYVFYVDNEKDLKNNIDVQKSLLGLYIDNDFSQNIKRGKPTSVQVIVDGRQTNSASIANGYITQIINDFSNEISPQKGAKINPIVRNWYNPNLEYRWYVLSILVAMLSVVVTLILTALSIARERELGNFDQLIVSPLSSMEILIGKTIPPMMISMTLTSIMTIIVTTCFGMPFVGSVLLFLVAIFISLLSIVGVGLFISAICNTQQQAILSVMTFMMPAMLLSGFISPIDNMPKVLQYITYLDPIRFFMVLTRGIFLKGMGIVDVLLNVIPLIIIAIITLTIAARTFKRKLG